MLSTQLNPYLKPFKLFKQDQKDKYLIIIAETRLNSDILCFNVKVAVLFDVSGTAPGKGGNHGRETMGAGAHDEHLVEVYRLRHMPLYAFSQNAFCRFFYINIKM